MSRQGALLLWESRCSVRRPDEADFASVIDVQMIVVVRVEQEVQHGAEVLSQHRLDAEIECLIGEKAESYEVSPGPEQLTTVYASRHGFSELAGEIKASPWAGRLWGLLEAFEEGDVIPHRIGHTVGESEQMQLSLLTRNSHPLRFDEVYCRESHRDERSRRRRRSSLRVDGFAWEPRHEGKCVVETELRQASHPNPVLAGDTLYAASRVLGKRDHNARARIVRFTLVGVKNETPPSLIRRGVGLLADRFDQKVFEIEREVLLPTRLTIIRILR